MEKLPRTCGAQYYRHIPLKTGMPKTAGSFKYFLVF
jgi:hypothetical protein